MIRSLFLLTMIATAGVFVCGDFALAQDDPKRGRASDSSSSGMTKAREAAALAFVREHHAELESLLIQLKEGQPKQYESAVRDLFRTSERLAAMSERDAPRAELELQAWQAKSRVHLLSATLLMTPSDKPTREKLKQALVNQSQARRELLELDRERTARRLDKIESQIKSIGVNAERTADQQIKLLLEGSREPKPTKASTNKKN